ncbi:MAG: hypothetical protein CMI54_04760 [Parcubacteria group bacterium]|nr:hypothetical protein [Parcubacteria group bacterium]|tara:strand:+ start:35367 stop:35624 length:258 start_codon:yes stop_codon:yes gene_type:complete
MNEEEFELDGVRIRFDYRYDYEDEILEIETVSKFCETLEMWIPMDYSEWVEYKGWAEDQLNSLENQRRRQEAETAYIDLTAGDFS